MKKLIYLAMIMAFLQSSCCKDEDTIVDSKAGTFVVTNLATGEVFQSDEAQFGFNGMYSSKGVKIAKGDTLKVVFTPKTNYRGVTFNRSCTNIKKVTDELYVVPDLSNKDLKRSEYVNYSYVDTTRISFDATYTGELNGDDYELSASRIIKVNRMTILK